MRIYPMRIVLTIFYLVLIIVGVTFAALNATTVQINLYVTTLSIPIVVVISISLAVGILFGILLFLSRYLRLKSTHRKLKNQLRLTEKEIKNLRAIPLHDQH